jgi:M6 family metalloprotease-like protein
VSRSELVAATVVAVLCLAAATRVAAQDGGADVIRRGLIHGGARPPAAFNQMRARPGAFEFQHGWLERARAVRQNRQVLRSRGAWQLLNAAAAPGGPAASATAVGGTLRYPTFLPLFSNTTAVDSALMDPTAVASRFWGTAPAPPYSVTTYYKEISGARLTVTGGVIPPIRVSQSDTFYSGGPSCQGLVPGCSKVPNLIAELVLHADSTVDFSRYVDTATGFVPAIVILDPQVGGECYQLYGPASNSIWAHRFSYSGWTGAPITTNDPWPGHAGQFVKIDDYIIQGGQGGNSGCSPSQLAPIGTVTHETGHLFGLPDLYDTSNQTEGIGRWDLMSSGNEQKPFRPAHMSAWTLATLGWISEVPVTTPQTVLANPVATSDTAYIVPIAGTPHHEYFLLENRQPIGSDSMMYGPGLMLYHVDTVLMAQRLLTNQVNAITPHALAVEEAAGDTGLNCTYPSACNDRGDAGDPFPGATGNTRFSAGTHPAANSYAGAFGGAIIDSIRQVAPFGAMQFRVTFGGVTTVWASDTNAVVKVDTTTTQVFRDVLADGSTHTVAIDSVQLGARGKTQYLFGSWSDGLARSHVVTGAQAGATYTAAVARRHLLYVLVLGTGSVSATRAIDSASGSFLAEGDSVTLTPVPPAGAVFAGWTGDTVVGTAPLTLRMARPYGLTATFTGTSDVVRQLLTGRSALNGGQLLVLDYLGNNNRTFDVGDFVAWLDRNPGVVSGAVLSRAPRRAVR